MGRKRCRGNCGNCLNCAARESRENEQQSGMFGAVTSTIQSAGAAGVHHYQSVIIYMKNEKDHLANHYKYTFHTCRCSGYLSDHRRHAIQRVAVYPFYIWHRFRNSYHFWRSSDTTRRQTTRYNKFYSFPVE